MLIFVRYLLLIAGLISGVDDASEMRGGPSRVESLSLAVHVLRPRAESMHAPAGSPANPRPLLVMFGEKGIDEKDNDEFGTSIAIAPTDLGYTRPIALVPSVSSSVDRVQQGRASFGNRVALLISAPKCRRRGLGRRASPPLPGTDPVAARLRVSFNKARFRGMPLAVAYVGVRAVEASRCPGVPGARLTDILGGSDGAAHTPPHTKPEAWKTMHEILLNFWENFSHNLFKPLLLFFYMGFLVPILKVKLDFPHVIYQGLTIFLLIAIGWHGGEELAHLGGSDLRVAGGFMIVGIITNFMIGITAYYILRAVTPLRRVDAATVAGYYGSDSAGTFATCVGVLVATNIAYAPYMPVLLAVMEIPGCLVALYLVSTLRRKGMDGNGNLPDEPGYDASVLPMNGEGESESHVDAPGGDVGPPKKSGRLLSPELLHEVFLNPGIFLLLAGIVIGFVSGKQGTKVTKDDDTLFIGLFQGMLCLFLLEMGMTASSKLRDLKTAGWRFILYGFLAPNLYATMGMIVAHVYGLVVHQHFDVGTYVLFAVLCGAASYIAVPAVQRLAIPEASPTLPLAASLGLTFSYNVTIGIPVYIEIARLLEKSFPA